MPEINGHKARSTGEIIEILERSGSFTFPDLPHYRYRPTKDSCRTLKRLGLTQLHGRSGIQVHIAPTALFREWQAAKAAGATNLGAVRWAKERTPEPEVDHAG